MIAVVCKKTDAEELFERLCDKVEPGKTFQYTAERWLQELLLPLGYERSDQSRVSHALAELAKVGMIRKSTVHKATGYHASRRRSDCPKPRQVKITLLG